MRAPKDRSSDPTSWGEVCSNVRFGEGLYQSCRDRIPSFTGFESGVFDEEMDEDEDEDVDFDRVLRKHAVAAPELPSPKASKKSKKKAEGLSATIEGLMTGDLGKYLMYGGGLAALGWWFWMQNKSQQVAVSDSPTAAAANATSATRKAA